MDDRKIKNPTMERFRGVYQVEKYRDDVIIHYVVPIHSGYNKSFKLVNPTRGQLIRFMRGFDMKPAYPIDGTEFSLYFLKKSGYAS